MRVSIAGVIYCAVALLGYGFPEAQGATSLTAEEGPAVLAELEGIWTLENDSGQTSYLAFADSPVAIYRSRLAEVDITSVRRYADAAEEAAELREALEDESGLSELSDRLGDALIERLDPPPNVPDTARDSASSEASAAINARLRERLGRRLRLMADAVEHGDGSLTLIDIEFARAPDMVGELDRQSTSLAYSGDRLYFVTSQRIWIYDRVSTLSGQSANDWADGGRRQWEQHLNDAYSLVFNRCVVYQRSDLPLDECRAHRDAIAAFGVELRPEFVLERFRDFKKPSDAEVAFWRNQFAASANWSATFPALEYCYGVGSEWDTVPGFMADLAGTGFANTLWRLSLYGDVPGEKPRNWTEQEFQDWAEGDLVLGNMQGAAIYLRGDGALGFGPDFGGLGFDLRNRWSYADDVIRLTWNDETVEVKLEVADFYNVEGTTNLALADQASAQLVLGNHDLLTKMRDPQQHPDYERLLPYAQSGRCASGGLTTALTVQTPEPEPEIDWPTRAASAFPSHWHGRFDMTDGSELPDPESWAEMQAGTYYYLLGSDSSRSGRLGTANVAPTSYEYAGGFLWEVSGSTMIWRFDQFDTFAFELPDSYTGTISAVGQQNPQYTMVLTPTDLVDPQTRRLRVAATEEAAAEANVVAASEAVSESETVVEPSAIAEAETPGPNEEPEPAIESVANPTTAALVGCWQWSNGARIAIDEEGAATNGPVRGQWRSLDAPNRFAIEWPPVEDSIALSSNGRSFDGVGVFGIRFSATRLDQGTGLAGRWRRQDGVVLEFAADGTATGGTLRGRWSGSGSSFRIEWPLVDEVTVSGNGDRLDVANQFGQATATKLPGC